MISFARNFTALRKKMGFSQEQMAEKCGVTRSALAKWETGNTTPDVYLIQGIAKNFGVTVDELLNGTINPITDSTMDNVYDKLNEMQRMILAAIEKEKKSDLYAKYCEICDERVSSDKDFEIEEKAEVLYACGTEYAEEGHYLEAVSLLEEALVHGEVNAVDMLMSIHNDILESIAGECNDLKYWSYKLEIAQKMQAYGKVVEEEIVNGSVF